MESRERVLHDAAGHPLQPCGELRELRAGAFGHEQSNLGPSVRCDGKFAGHFGGLPSGFSTVSLAESAGKNTIGGISIYVPSAEMDWEGFGISNIRIGLDDGDVNGGGDPQVPEPATWLVWSILGSLAVGSSWYHRRLTAR